MEVVWRWYDVIETYNSDDTNKNSVNIVNLVKQQ